MNTHFTYKINDLTELKSIHLSVYFEMKKKNSIINNLFHLIKKTRYKVIKYSATTSTNPLIFFYNPAAKHNCRYTENAAILTANKPINKCKKIVYHNDVSSYYRYQYQNKKNVEAEYIKYDEKQNILNISIMPSTIIQNISQFLTDCDLYEIEIDVCLLNPDDFMFNTYIRDYFAIRSIQPIISSAF